MGKGSVAELANWLLEEMSASSTWECRAKIRVVEMPDGQMFRLSLERGRSARELREEAMARVMEGDSE